MRPDGAFTALLLLSAAAAVIVPPPTNVSVFCTNLHVTVRWTHNDTQAHTRFHVRIQGSDGVFEDETAAHEYDVSPYVWQSHLHYMDFMDVTVTALQGEELSQPVATPSFTFNGLKKAHVTCALEFPPVNVAAEGAATAVTFHNPFHFYTQLRNSERRRDAFFKFTVVSEQGESTSVCLSTQTVCRHDLEEGGAEGGAACVTLRGWLDYGNNVEHVPFKETDRICAAAPGSHTVVITVLLVVLVFVVLVVSISIYAVKAWSLEPALKPTLPFLVLPNPNRGRHFFPVTKEEIHPVSVVGHASRSPSVCSEGGDCRGEAGSGDAGHGADLQPPPFASSYTDGQLLEDSGQDLEGVALMSAGHGTDEDSADDSVRTECFCIGEGEGEEPRPEDTEPHPEDNRSHYDRPHTS